MMTFENWPLIWYLLLRLHFFIPDFAPLTSRLTTAVVFHGRVTMLEVEEQMLNLTKAVSDMNDLISEHQPYQEVVIDAKDDGYAVDLATKYMC
ncbi:unnamed protein product [Rotaria sp. Silwood2]|nr:unnamed protein product [Rotaria sp. Silwood2]CAF4019796.1 unnamed protein product [Rotaria sp. Silwood2]